MFLLLSVAVFLCVVAGGAAVGLKMYVRPKEALERVTGTFEAEQQMPSHPSLAFHDLIKRLGNFVPQSPKDVTVMRRRLIRAGIRNENALKILYGAKAALGVALPLIVGSMIAGSATESGNKIFAILAAVGVGFFGPNEYVRKLATKRQHEISRGLPNALDLLVVCVESGLGLATRC